MKDVYLHTMKEVILTVPDNLGLSEKDLKMLLAGQLYEQGKLTLGQAAGMVGISKKEFIETMGDYGFSLFSSSVEDLRSDIKNA